MHSSGRRPEWKSAEETGMPARRTRAITAARIPGGRPRRRRPDRTGAGATIAGTTNPKYSLVRKGERGDGSRWNDEPTDGEGIIYRRQQRGRAQIENDQRTCCRRAQKTTAKRQPTAEETQKVRATADSIWRENQFRSLHADNTCNQSRTEEQPEHAANGQIKIQFFMISNSNQYAHQNVYPKP